MKQAGRFQIFILHIFTNLYSRSSNEIYKQPEVMYCSKSKSLRCSRACMVFNWSCRQWLGTILTESHFLIVPGTFSQGWRLLNTWRKGKVYGVRSCITQSSPGRLLEGKGRVASLVRASEYTNFKPVAVHTLFCWQCVFLLSLSLLQFGLVKGCDLRDVWFVTHVCRWSSKERPQLDKQEVMRTWEGKLQREWGWGR